MIYEIIGWTGSAFLAAGLYGIGNKQRGAFALSIVGESLWIIRGVGMHAWDIVAICIVFLLMAARAYVNWECGGEGGEHRAKKGSPCCSTQPRRYPEQRCKVCDCPAPCECDLKFGGSTF